LTATVMLSSHQSPQATAHKAIDCREGEPMGVLEVTIPAPQHRIQRRNRDLDGMPAATLGVGTDLIP